MIRTVLFDIDGTLVDSNGAHAASWHEALRAFGYEVPVQTIRPLIGMGSDTLLPALDLGLEQGTDPGKSIAEKRARIFMERYVEALEPTPGARALLQALRERGLRCVVATSARREELDRLLERAGVADLVDEASTADDASRSKPSPDIVGAALAKVRADPREAVLVGDTRYDIDAARRAGVTPVAVLCGGADPATLRDAAAVYRDPAALLAGFDASPLAT